MTETVYELRSPTGRTEAFTSYTEAVSAQASDEFAGAQIRTRIIEKDLPAEYAVMVDGEVVSRHQRAHDAAVEASSIANASVGIVAAVA